MSYILDALNKADKERQKEDLPDIHTIYSTPTKKSRKSIKITISVVILFLGGSALFLQYFRLTDSLNISVVEFAKSPSPVTTTTVDNIELQEISKQLTDVLKEPLPETRKDDAGIVYEPEPIGAVVAKSEPVIMHPIVDPAVPHLHKLTEKIRKSIPPLEYAGHTYSDLPDKRIIVINNKILREGESVEAGLILQEITWDGAILNYKGLVFHDSFNGQEQ